MTFFLSTCTFRCPFTISPGGPRLDCICDGEIPVNSDETLLLLNRLDLNQVRLGYQVKIKIVFVYYFSALRASIGTHIQPEMPFLGGARFAALRILSNFLYLLWNVLQGRDVSFGIHSLHTMYDYLISYGSQPGCLFSRTLNTCDEV